MKVSRHAPALLISLALAACSETRADEGETARKEGNAVAQTDASPPSPNTAEAAGGRILRLSAPAERGAIDAARLAAERIGVTGVAIHDTQSFRIMDGAVQVATLVSGEGKAADAVYHGCFLALVQGGKVRVVPTIGSGNWETVACGETVALALLDHGGTPRIGAIYSAFSPNASVTEPLVLDWDRAGADLAINQPLSTKASLAGAGTITQLRAALR